MAGCRPPPDAQYKSVEQLIKTNDFRTAINKTEEEFGRYRSQPQSQWHWKFRLKLVELKLLNGDTKEAKTLLQQSPAKDFPQLQPRYNLLYGYALARAKGTERDQAAKLFNEAIRGARAVEDHETEVDGWLYLGYLLDGSKQDKERALQTALDGARRYGLEFEQAQALLNLGLMQVSQDAYGAAIPYFEQSQSIALKSDASFLNAILLEDLGVCYLNLGSTERAKQLLESALAIQKNSGLKTLRSHIDSDLGALYLINGQVDQASRSFRAALSSIKEDSSPKAYALAAGRLALALATAGSYDEAEHYNEIAFRLAGKQNQIVLGSVSQGEVRLTSASIAERRGQSKRARDFLLEAQELDPAPSIQWQAQAGLARVYSTLGDFPKADAAYQKTLAIIAANRADQLKTDYKITFLNNLMRFYQDYVALLIQHGEPNRALEIADSSRASVLTEALLGKSATQQTGLLKKIQTVARASHSVFLFYWLNPKTSYVWAINGERSLAVPLEHPDEILRDAASYRAAVETPGGDPLSIGSHAGAQLYQNLVAPVESLIPAGSRVVIVPDGVLHNLNFETLLVSQPKPHYWLEDVTISVAPSLEILTAENRARGDGSLLVIGDPLLKGTDFQELPKAAAEINLVKAHFDAARTTPLTGGDAVVSAYASAQPQNFSTIHFTTHVDANAASPLDSAIILSPSANGFRLYARDVAQIPLKADLVTISACKGAGAKALSGEGLVGFAWAFFQARAQNVVTSLWDVYDDSTPQLMDKFYAGVQNGRSYADALRDAKLSMLQSAYKRPYYWAPFQLYSRNIGGVTRPKTKPRGTQDRASAHRTQTASGL